MNNPEVIVFDNLRQRTGVIGKYDQVSAMSKPFVSTNAHGLLHEVKDHTEISLLASRAGDRMKKLLASDE